MLRFLSKYPLQKNSALNKKTKKYHIWSQHCLDELLLIDMLNKP